MRSIFILPFLFLMCENKINEQGNSNEKLLEKIILAQENNCYRELKKDCKSDSECKVICAQTQCTCQAVSIYETNTTYTDYVYEDGECKKHQCEYKYYINVYNTDPTVHSVYCVNGKCSWELPKPDPKGCSEDAPSPDTIEYDENCEPILDKSCEKDSDCRIIVGLSHGPCSCAIAGKNEKHCFYWYSYIRDEDGKCIIDKYKWNICEKIICPYSGKNLKCKSKTCVAE